MTRIEARKLKYCNKCAAFYVDQQHCGITRCLKDRRLCSLDDETIVRWKKEYGLESYTRKKGG